ncbi:cactin-like protein [Cryptosporidium canis]|uniref:Cactin-like protein n=1 Tax=Cryptosporidium canis TaxID=195482 RepID=A0ABQ8P733_9CRYT|nr:cactin-like protein [Cryptosporidium canis]KAJ1610878.1 cactin-like protein [Cryptosporidium canis]
MNDLEFEKKQQLKKCRESRELSIREIGYSDEFNPFGDNNLSLPFIWKKKFEQEKDDHSFELKCRAYPWYKFGVCPINTTEIIEIKKRRENFEEKSANKVVADSRFDYEKWLEDGQKFDKLQLHSSSIIRIREHRGNVFDALLWKLIIYSYFMAIVSEDKTPCPEMLSLIKIGLSASKSYLNSLKHNKILKFLDEAFKLKSGELKRCVSEIFQIVNKHLQLVSIETEIPLIPEWHDIIEGIEIIIKSGMGKFDKSNNLCDKEDQEIDNILENKELSELKDILHQSINEHDDYWKKVALRTKSRICNIHVGEIERSYCENFERWFNLLVSKCGISLHEKEYNPNELIYSGKNVSSNDDLNSQVEDFEKVDQLIKIPVIEFFPSEKSSTRNSSCIINELLTPRVYSMMKTRYYWNQYNRNYYSNETLPPKTIQGYKIKIKYPHLNKQENAYIVPRWYITTKNKYLEKNKLLVANEEALLKVQEDIILHENENSAKNKLLIITCDHRIYKDVGFSIIDREWDLNPKNGFKSFFENATLHLNFNFKQPKYKR